MKAILIISLAIVLIIVFTYINFAPAFKLDLDSLFNFPKQPYSSSAPTATTAPIFSGQPAVYQPVVPAATSAMPFRGPTSFPHVNGPTSPPPITGTSS